MSEPQEHISEKSQPAGYVDTRGTGVSATRITSKGNNAPIDTISGVTKEFFEARSAETPEAKKRENITGIIAIIIALIVLALFAFGSKLGLG